ncbi:precorrin-6y C5,15-methyltransferase (decarboxylating) subunit CbiE [Pseudobacteroides cellulosolvens]|nr:precorrin-6y C5,15-methyltransferase (decarboxylating) subunit CbiE [Pseudobacteroides cellulosolvens]
MEKVGMGMGNKVYILGVGPGDKALICPEAEKVISNCHVLIGGIRNLQVYGNLDCERIKVGNNLDEIAKYIMSNMEQKNIAVLASGDPGVFGILEYLKGKIDNDKIHVVPGISSFQYLCAKMKISWQDAFLTSVHGRDQADVIDIVRKNKKTIIFAGGDNTPEKICSMFFEKGLKDVTVTIGEKLSYKEERITTGKPDSLMKMTFEKLSVLLVLNEKCTSEPKGPMDNAIHGIPDDMFIRGDVPMTKEEIRTVSISKLRLRENYTVFDVGAGTGSVSIECALRCTKGQVYAIEKEKDAVKLIEENIEKFRANNINIIHGKAPDVLTGLPEPDCVFIGGSSGKMNDILECISNCKGKIRVVTNAVTIESAYEAIKGLEEKGFGCVDVVLMSVSKGRSVGGKHLMQALNPVYIISGEYGGRQ